MTVFEELAKEIGVKLTCDNDGFYTGMAKALGVIVNDIILSNDDEIFEMPWAKQKVLIKDNFYRVFPYMKK